MDLVINKMKVKDITKKNFLHRPNKDGNQDAYDEDDYGEDTEEENAQNGGDDEEDEGDEDDDDFNIF